MNGKFIVWQEVLNGYSNFIFSEGVHIWKINTYSV